VFEIDSDFQRLKCCAQGQALNFFEKTNYSLSANKVPLTITGMSVYPLWGPNVPHDDSKT